VNRNDFRELGWWLVIGIAAIVIGIVVWLGIVFTNKHTADFRGSAAVTEQVRGNGNYRIAAYDSFFNQCSAIQGKEATIAALKTELATNPPADRVAQINATITAVTASRGQAIAAYNADAAKSDTQGHFLASNLPFHIDPAQEATTCATR
jgi:hypothetical protein